MLVLIGIGLGALVNGILHRSLWAGVVGILYGLGGLFVLFIIAGIVGAALERLDDLRDEAKERQTPLILALARAWAWGLVCWLPAQALLTQFVLAWAAVGVAVFFLAPKLLAGSLAGKIGAAALLVFAAGFINAAFHRDGE